MTNAYSSMKTLTRVQLVTWYLIGVLLSRPEVMMGKLYAISGDRKLLHVQFETRRILFDWSKLSTINLLGVI